ncbi:uncharacterized protein LOC134784357 [Penaeus indicus]|uniref:uncharacterized protein LOC134784357 n=1 Tax=Penaeus indicus TaxID=29960 RepID=UPI00300D2C9F
MVSLDLKINESKVKASRWKLAMEHTGKGLPTHVFEGKKSKKKNVEKEKELTEKQKKMVGLTAKQKDILRREEWRRKKIEETRKRRKGKKYKNGSKTCTTETKAMARGKKKQESRDIAQTRQSKKNEQSQKSKDNAKRKQPGTHQESNAVKANKKKANLKSNQSKQNPSPSKLEQHQKPTKTKQTVNPTTEDGHKKGKKHPLARENHAEEKTLTDTHSCRKKKQNPRKRKMTEEAETQGNSVKEQPAKKQKIDNLKKLGNSPQLSKPVAVKRIKQSKPMKKTTLTELKLKGGVSKYEKAVGSTALSVYSRRENEKQLLREAFAKNASK